MSASSHEAATVDPGHGERPAVSGASGGRLTLVCNASIAGNVMHLAASLDTHCCMLAGRAGLREQLSVCWLTGVNCICVGTRAVQLSPAATTARLYARCLTLHPCLVGVGWGTCTTVLCPCHCMHAAHCHQPIQHPTSFTFSSHCAFAT